MTRPLECGDLLLGIYLDTTMSDKIIPITPINRRSANITQGKSRAPNRSMYYAMGYE